MAEYRQLKIKMWQDNWFLSLNSNEKLMWIFLLTNPSCHISGFYELPKPLVSPLVGLPRVEWENILSKFMQDKKIYYGQGWIYILNFQKHQAISQKVKDNVVISIKKQLEDNKEILKKISPLQGACKPLLGSRNLGNKK